MPIACDNHIRKVSISQVPGPWVRRGKRAEVAVVTICKRLAVCKTLATGHVLSCR